MQGFWLLWSSCFTSALGHALAVVRPYASRTEVQSLEGSFLRGTRNGCEWMRMGVLFGSGDRSEAHVSFFWRRP